ncbi:SigE family RNA polymerase sigma factor [Streptomyces sp. BI20]|uniref:SigE family RNA polymerase sigma factor n=1 Tax=Streptomyces sp. BI20 TaxID=3403460 RepID=UPI003C77F4C9
MTEDEFDAFYSHTVRRLTGRLYVMTGDFHEAQDVVQEAFVRAWGKRHALEFERGPEAWVRTVAWRLAVSRRRRVLRDLFAWRRRAEPAVADPPDAVLPGVDLAAVLRRMPDRQRRVVTLHYVCDLSVEETAREMGVSPGTVKTHLARARARLEARLGPAERRGVKEEAGRG